MGIREDIIESALALLRAHGFGALTQPRIATEAGVRQSHLTYYFPARTDMLLAVANRSCEVLLAPLAERARRGDLTVDQVVDALGDAVTDRGVARIFHALISASDEDEGLKRQMRRFQKDAVHDLQALFGSAGLALPDRDALMVHAMICGASSMDLCLRSEASRRDARAILRRQVELLGWVSVRESPSARRDSRTRPGAPQPASPSRKARGTPAVAPRAPRRGR